MLNRFENIYFLGIGGIGMSALAQYFKTLNYNVAGYDLNTSSITEMLQNKGIEIVFEDSIETIPKRFRDENKTLVVYTPAVPKSNIQYRFFEENNFTIKKRSEILGIISNENKNIAIAGTHGKTTTTSMISHILNTAQKLKAAFVGGVMKNYNSNFIINQNNNDYIVLEADEYDRSFLKLKPDIAIINSTDPDHLDIYNTPSNFEQAFIEFAKLVKEKLIVNNKIKLKFDANCPIFNFGYTDDCFFYIKNIDITDKKQFFDIAVKNDTTYTLKIQLPGKINIENATAAFAACYFAGIDTQIILKALETFTGTQRRFDIVFENNDYTLINDYAHHPHEIEGLFDALNSFFPDKKYTIIFQPHLFSRTLDFHSQFASVLSKFHQVILLPIYPAREKPIEGVSSQLIFDQITTSNKYICTKNELLDLIKKINFDVLLTVGAGDIDKLVPILIDFLTKNKEL